MKSIKQCWAALDFYEESPVPILKNKLEQFQFWFLKERKKVLVPILGPAIPLKNFNSSFEKQIWFQVIQTGTGS